MQQNEKIMDYESKYNELVEAARAVVEGNPGLCNIDEGLGRLSKLLPEKESEDEKIRKELIGHCKDLVRMNQDDKVMLSVYEPWLAYLEKQKDLPFVKDVMLGYPGHYFYDGERMHFCGNPAMEEKQKDQKPAEWNEKDDATIKRVSDIIRWCDIPVNTPAGKFGPNEREKLLNDLAGLHPHQPIPVLREKEIIIVKRLLDYVRKEHNKRDGEDFTNEIPFLEWLISHPFLHFDD